MMANRSFRAQIALLLTALLAGCVAPTRSPPPPRPQPALRGPYVPPRPPVTRDWRDAALTPGDWHWVRESTGGVAWYGLSAQTPAMVLRCARPGAELTMQVSGNGVAATSPRALILSITTTGAVLPANGARTADGGVLIRFAVHDPVLDAMAFSRGRFMIAAEGLAPVIVPSWPEVSRAIESCRAPV